MRLIHFFAISALLSGCSILLDAELPTLPDPEPDSTDLNVIFEKIAGIYPGLKLTGAPLISRVRKSESVSIANWVICLRNDAPADTATDARYYAVFIKKNEIVDYRLAVVLDRCEMQSFEPLPKPERKKLG